MQVVERSVASRTDEFAELKGQLDVVDANITLVNKRLDESQGMWLFRGHLVRELDTRALQHVCLMQMVPLLWRTFEQSLLEQRSRPEGVMRLPRRRPKS